MFGRVVNPWYGEAWAASVFAFLCVGYRRTGTHRRGGFRRLCASIAKRAGTGTAAGLTGAVRRLRTRVVCSSRRRRGNVSAAAASPGNGRPASSYFGPGWYGHATDIHGGSGDDPVSSAGSGDGLVSNVCDDPQCPDAYWRHRHTRVGVTYDHVAVRFGETLPPGAWERENRRLLGGGS